MLGRLTQAGWQVVDTPEAAQLLLVNTCGFIQEACREAVDTILELARHKEADPTKRLAVTGCLVQRYGEDLPAELPEVDYFIGVHDFPALLEILDRGPGTGDGAPLSPGRLPTVTATPRPATPPRRDIWPI